MLLYRYYNKLIALKLVGKSNTQPTESTATITNKVCTKYLKNGTTLFSNFFQDFFIVFISSAWKFYNILKMNCNSYNLVKLLFYLSANHLLL